MQNWRNKLWSLLLHSGIRISFLYPVPFKVCCLSSRLQRQSDSGSIEAHTKVNATPKTKAWFSCTPLEGQKQETSDNQSDQGGK